MICSVYYSKCCSQHHLVTTLHILFLSVIKSSSQNNINTLPLIPITVMSYWRSWKHQTDMWNVNLKSIINTTCDWMYTTDNNMNTNGTITCRLQMFPSSSWDISEVLMVQTEYLVSLISRHWSSKKNILFPPRTT